MSFIKDMHPVSRIILTALLAAALILIGSWFLPTPMNEKPVVGANSADAHLVIGYYRAKRIMRGTIANECPGRNHLICFTRRDAFIYRVSRTAGGGTPGTRTARATSRGSGSTGTAQKDRSATAR